MSTENIFKKILVSADGSLPSIAAQELTASIAKKFKSKVTVIHVIAHELMNPAMRDLLSGGADTDILSAGITRGDYTIPTQMPKQPSTAIRSKIAQEITDLYREEGKDIIADATALFKEEGVTADQILVERSDIAETILKEAETGDYDLIAMGYSGEKEKEPHLGSVTAKVARHSEVPVLVTRERRQITKILVPISGTEKTENIVKHAANLAKKTNAKMTLLHVQESRLFKLRPKITEEIGDRILTQIANHLEGIKVDKLLESGDPAKVILKTAEDGNYDLIIMGNKSRSTPGRFLLGSVSDHILHYTDVPILLVK